MRFTEVHIIDSELRGCDGGVHIKNEFGQQLGSWPMGHEEAEERVQERWPNARIVHHETEEAA